MNEICDEERAIHLAELSKRFPLSERTKTDDENDLETLHDFLGIFFTHPLGLYRNSATVNYFLQQNSHLKDITECASQTTRNKSVSRSASSSSMGKVGTYPQSARSPEMDKEEYQFQLKIGGYKTDPWEGVPDFCIMSHPEDKKRINEMSEEIIETVLKRYNKNLLPSINVRKFSHKKIPLGSMKDYGEIFSSNKDFDKLLHQVNEKLINSKSTAEVIEYCEFLKRETGNPYGSYFADYLSTCLFLTMGDVSRAKIIIDAALVPHDPTDLDVLGETLVNSLLILKAVVELTVSEHMKCFECLEKVLDNDCANSDSHNIFVKLLLEGGHVAEAINYMKYSNFVTSMHSDVVKTMFRLSVIYYQTRHEEDGDSGELFFIFDALGTAINLKKLGRIPIEMMTWIIAITVNVLRNARYLEEYHIDFLRSFFADIDMGVQAQGSSRQMLKRGVDAINICLQSTNENLPTSITEMNATCQKLKSKPLSQQKSDVALFMRSKQWNFFILRFLHSYALYDWIRLNHGNEMTSLPETRN